MKLYISVPAGEQGFVEFGRHFNVQGSIEYEGSTAYEEGAGHRGVLPEDCVFTVRLIDSQGQVLRYTRQTQKNNRNVYLDHPDLTTYPEEMDPGREGLLLFGFPELLVKDLAHPEESLRNATIKCWYSDDCFKAVIVSATGVAQGSIFEDGMGYLDENGAPYTVLPEGNYTVEAELATVDGRCLARTAKEIRIGRSAAQAIVRFHPDAHREKMIEWCQENQFSVSNETLPGYLEAYTGTWLYHMGLLPMYRANDIVMYETAQVHMFVYLIDPTSTSYETELAYLQTKGVIEDPKRFSAYYYDIGEAVIGSGRAYERRGRILAFAEDQFLALCRVDVVNEKARENRFDLSEEAVEEMCTDLNQVTVPAGCTIAITGVVRPWQLDPRAFALRPDNTYEMRDSVCALHYVLDDGETVRRETRSLLMERFAGQSIGTSVYEFYNLFQIDSSLKGKDLTIRLCACDRSGEKNGARGEVTVHVCQMEE